MDSRVGSEAVEGTMDAAGDARLVSELQERFPLAVAPFRILSERLGGSEDEVLARVVALRDAGILRHVTPIFEAAALGFTSCLVAMRIPVGRLDAAVAAINAHPGVTHNYRREHAFNLWFTIAVPPDTDLQAHIARLHEVAGSLSTRPLPNVRLFKIGVSLDMSGSRPLNHRDAPKSVRPHDREVAPLTPLDIDLIRAVQGDLPLTARPFRDAALALGISEDAIVRELELLRDRGVLRRVAGILRHRAAGFSANGMAVWDVPDERVGEVGEAFAAYSAISHCYQRPRYDDWPYSIFTMIHARSQEECDAFVQELARTHGVEMFTVLYSTMEYKKVRPVYFSPDVATWERGNGIPYEPAG